MGLSETSAHPQDAVPTIIVSDSAALATAIRTLAEGTGGTVLLDGTAGSYTLHLSQVAAGGAGVHLAPLDPDVPPVITKMTLDRSSGLSISGVEFRTVAADGVHDIRIFQSSDITLRGNHMQGVADGYDDGTVTRGDAMMLIRDSKNIVFAENVVRDYSTGIGVLDTVGLRIENNEFTRLQGDGIQGGGLQDTVIAGNHFHDFWGSLQSINHSDMIQIWGYATRGPSRNVEIRDNLLDAGQGAATQGIFIRNETFGWGDGDPVYFENVVIDNNVIHNGARGGIAASNIDGLQITRNTLLWNTSAETRYTVDQPSGGLSPWISSNASLNATISGNVAEQVALDAGTRAAALEIDNVLLSYVDRANGLHARDLFTNWDGASPLDLRDFALRPDTGLMAAGYGAQLGVVGLQAPDPVAVMMITSDPRDPLVIILQAAVMDAAGQLHDPVGLTARWLLADGTVLEGHEQRHGFAGPGVQDVRLELVAPDGAVMQVSRSVEIEDPVLLRMDFDGPLADLSQFDSTLLLRDADGVSAVDGLSGGGFLLDGVTSLETAWGTTQLYNLDRFVIDLDVNPLAVDSYGVLLSQHTIMRLFVTADAGVGFALTTDQGNFSAQSAGGVLQAGQWANLKVDYDGRDGLLSLRVDGETVAESAASGMTSGPTPWGMVLGRTWAPAAKAVVDNLSIARYEIDLPQADPAPAPEMAPPVETLFDFRFDGDLVDQSAYGTATTAHGDPDTLFDTRDGRTGVHLRDGVEIQLSRTSEHLSRLDSFDLNLELSKDADDVTGGLVALHTIFSLDIRPEGKLLFLFTTDEGGFRLDTDKNVLSDTDWASIRISYSDADDRLAMYVNDVLEAETWASGTTAALTHWPLAVGRPWGNPAEVLIDSFSMTRPLPADYDMVA